jgi:hypothetical protein
VHKFGIGTKYASHIAYTCEEADALRKASEDGESEIASKISRKQVEEHTGTENKGSNFERNHFRNLPSSNVKGYGRPGKAN